MRRMTKRVRLPFVIQSPAAAAAAVVDARTEACGLQHASLARQPPAALPVVSCRTCELRRTGRGFSRWRQEARLRGDVP